MKTRIPLFCILIFVQNILWGAQNLEIVVQSGHSDLINGFSLHDDDHHALTSSKDGSVKMWDVWTGKEIRTIHPALSRESEYQGDPIRALFLPNNRICCWSDTKLEIFNAENGKETGIIDLTSAKNVGEASISPDGQLLAVAAGRGLRLINTTTLSQIKIIEDPESDWGTLTAFSPDGKELALVSGKIVDVYDLQTGRKLIRYTGHQNSILKIAVCESIIATADMDEIHFWNPDNGKPVKVIRGINSSRISFSRSKDGKTLLYSIENQEKKGTDLSFFNGATGSFNRTMNMKPFYLVSPVFSKDGKTIIAATTSYSSDPNSLIQIDAITGHVLKIIGTHVPSFKIGSLNEPENSIAGFSDDRLVQWNLKNGRIQHEIPLPGRPWFMSLSKDGSRLAIAGEGVSNGIVIMDAQSGVVLARIKTSVNFIPFLEFSPDGKKLAYPYSDKDFHVADTSTGKDFMAFTGHTGTVQAVIFNPDGSRIFSGGNDLTVKQWDAQSGAQIMEYKYKSFLEAGVIDGLALSPGARTIAANVNGERITLFNIDDGKKVWSVKVPLRTLSMVFTPDGKNLVLGNTQGAISFLNSADGMITKTLNGHINTVRSLFFSKAGDRLFSSGDDGRLRIWNILENTHVDLITTKGRSGNEWISVTDDGYWDGSPGCSSLVAAVNGMESWNIDQNAPLSDRPDIVLQRLGNMNDDLQKFYFAAYEKRLKRLGIDAKNIKTVKPPEIKLQGIERSAAGATVTFSCKAGSSPLAKYRIFIDGCPVNTPSGDSLSMEGNMKVSIPVPQHETMIEVSCVDTSGVESLRSTYFLPGDEKSKGGLFFLGFGVSSYKDDRLNLGYAAKDAQDLASVFTKPSPLYSFMEKKVFTNMACTIGSFSIASQFLSRAKPDDSVVLFLAGHGVHDTNTGATYYYLTWETEWDQLSKTAVPFETIESLLSQCSAGKKLCLLDTCESGEKDDGDDLISSTSLMDGRTRGFNLKVIKERINTSPRSYLFERDRFIYNDLSRRSGAVVFSSCRGDELSYEFNNLKNGIFTSSLINALNGAADRDDKGLIDLTELREYVTQAVIKRTSDEKNPYGLQHPVIDRDNIHAQFEFTCGTDRRK